MTIEKILEYKINADQSILGVKIIINDKFGFASAIFKNSDILLIDSEKDHKKKHELFQNLRIKKVFSLVDQFGALSIFQGNFIMPTKEEFIEFNKKYLLTIQIK